MASTEASFTSEVWCNVAITIVVGMRTNADTRKFAAMAAPSSNSSKTICKRACRSARRKPASVLRNPVRDGAGAKAELDWQPLLAALEEGRAAGVGPAELAAEFHHALARGIVAVAHEAGAGTIALGGGCFQNALLLDLTADALEKAGFEVLRPRELPPNDGGIAAGQALGAIWNLTTVQLP